jgi:hypothetical protein
MTTGGPPAQRGFRVASEFRNGLIASPCLLVLESHTLSDAVLNSIVP